MKTYTVEKGNHYCLHGQWLHINQNGMVVSFTVHPESSYETMIPQANQQDVNKIGGITFGLNGIHENSIRIGMCGDATDASSMYVYLYYYNHGTRTMVQLTKTLYGIYNSWYIAFDRTNNQLKVINRMGSDKFTMPYDFNGVPNWGFYCYPYFGGTQVAPVDYVVDLKVVTTRT